MCIEKSHRLGRLSKTVAACAFTLGALSGSFNVAFAQQSPIPSQGQQARADVPRVTLEHAFWACDYTATVRGVHAAPVALCSAVTEDLKNAKFGGDFEEMLKWWRQHKHSAHQQMAERNRLATVEPVANR